MTSSPFSPLWKSCDVWRRMDDQAVRYRCFQNLQTGKFFVQSADCYQLPLDPERTKLLDTQFLELFVEEEPSDRTAGYPTIEEAINAHDNEFKIGMDLDL